MDPTGPVARRFPLVPRPRPACTPLPTRIAGLCDLARTAHRDGDQAAASAVFNQAALVASDVGLPGLARQWCHRHAAARLRSLAPEAQAARYALEPLVNLGRLHIRAGDGDAAYRLLDTLWQAVTSRSDTTIDGITVPTSTLTSPGEQHDELVRWMWGVHLADGTRALTSAGRWDDATDHLRRHNGVGLRLLDGRQVAVIARLCAADPGGAVQLLAEATPQEAWERAVASCLTVLSDTRTGSAAQTDITTMLHLLHRLQHAPGLTIFHTRLALTAIDAAGGVDRPQGFDEAATLIEQATTTPDGYTARDLLCHSGCASAMTPAQRAVLSAVVAECGLGRGAIPPELRAALRRALDGAEATIDDPTARGHRARAGVG